MDRSTLGLLSWDHRSEEQLQLLYAQCHSTNRRLKLGTCPACTTKRPFSIYPLADVLACPPERACFWIGNCISVIVRAASDYAAALFKEPTLLVYLILPFWHATCVRTILLFNCGMQLVGSTAHRVRHENSVAQAFHRIQYCTVRP